MTDDDARFRFLQRWVMALGVVGAIIGLLMIVAVETPVFTAYNGTAEAAFLGGAKMSPDVFRLSWWVMATMGAGVIGWSIQIIYVAAGPFARKERWAHTSLSLSIAVWIVLDIAIAAARPTVRNTEEDMSIEPIRPVSSSSSPSSV